MVKTGIPLIR